jgi:TM2 domain-containing membrane protein YozV
MDYSNDTHLKSIGYILWIFGFTGSHRFYYGKPISGTIWFFTLGLFFIGWIIDIFLIPSMDRQADFRYRSGSLNYTVAWILLTFIRHTPFLYGKVVDGDSLPTVGRHLRYRVSI